MNVLSMPCRVFLAIVSCFSLAMVAVADENSAADSDAGEYLQLKNCVQRNSIRRTDIVDDRTILFYMNQKKIYVNQLPHRCSGLRIAGAFGYRTYASRLCDVDVITVIRTGGGSWAGPSCGLGKFRPVTAEEAAMIKSKETELPPQESVPAEDGDKKDADTRVSDEEETIGS